MYRPLQDPAEPPASPASRVMYTYHGDPDTCLDFIKDCAHHQDITASEFEKVSFMVLCLRDEPLRWAADLFDVDLLQTVSFWDFARLLLLTFGRDPPPPVAPATSSISPPSAPKLQSVPAPVQTIRTGFISFSPEPVGAVLAPLMGQITTPSPGPDNAASSSLVGP
uniref:Uncharacterized protein n=1 Tax=Nothobranchius kadleci TaxID=1051664 RepID=A0A1A8BS40_NOTKA